MTVVKGGHSCRDLILAVMDAQQRVDKIFDLTGPKRTCLSIKDHG